MLLQHIIDIIESVAPLRWQEEWDNSGLQVGNRNADVNKVLLATDVTESVVSEAIALKCDLIISHHPLIFHPLKQLCGQTPQARCAETAIKNNIAIYSSHTAMDSWLNGVSGRMAEKIGINDYHILQPTGQDELIHGLGVIGQLPRPITLTELLQLVKTAFEAPVLRQDVLDISDLEIGQKLEGTVRNVVDFGAFVDIGLHDDGLIHISQMSKSFVKHPSQVVSVGDVVTVWVSKIAKERGKINLSLVDLRELN